MKSRRMGVLPFLVSLCLFAMLAVTAPVAQAEPLSKEDLKKIDFGSKLFNKETFKGNGRTCASCHIPKNKYSISPADIAKMSRREFKKLAVTSRAWGHTPVPGLENPKLLKGLGLFNEGTGNALKPNDTRMQSSPKIDGIALTMVKKFSDQDQLGWNGDGAAGAANAPFPCDEIFPEDPANGNLISFARGAVAQHFTKSLARNVGTDFRCPNPKENEAMEKFQLWIGRREWKPGVPEIPLGEITFATSAIEEGKSLFVNSGGCNACHPNGGANFPDIGIAGGNIRFDTNVEEAGKDLLDQVAGFTVKENMGGLADLGPPVPGAFNIPPTIGTTSIGRYFHNNLVTKVEDSIAFYFEQDFLVSPGAFGFCGGASDEQACQDFLASAHGGTFESAVNHIGAFMRALDAFYELKDCERLLKETIHRIKLRISTKLPAQHCGFNLDHVYKSLSGAQVEPRPYMDVAKKARSLKFDIKIAAEFRIKRELEMYIRKIKKMRESMATIIGD